MLTEAYEFELACGDTEMCLYDSQGKVYMTDLSKADATVMEALRGAAETREVEPDAINSTIVMAWHLTF